MLSKKLSCPASNPRVVDPYHRDLAGPTVSQKTNLDWKDAFRAQRPSLKFLSSQNPKTHKVKRTNS